MSGLREKLFELARTSAADRASVDIPGVGRILIRTPMLADRDAFERDKAEAIEAKKPFQIRSWIWRNLIVREDGKPLLRPDDDPANFPAALLEPVTDKAIELMGYGQQLGKPIGDRSAGSCGGSPANLE